VKIIAFRNVAIFDALWLSQARNPGF